MNKIETTLESQNEQFIIPVDGLYSNFADHLNIKNNSRIFFSGKFGIGKTFFLHEFFNHYEKEYEIFHLFPINYQISSNEDVVELLKYDILIELLKKNNSIFQENKVGGIKDSWILFSSWCKSKYSTNSVLQSTISLGESFLPTPLNKLGRPMKDLLEIDKKFQEFKKEHEKGEKGVVEKYIEEFKKKNITETDYLSHLLKQGIKKQKVGKKSVLILDDLDRMDPEHIFRILNVFSAHFDSNHVADDMPNKFGFDKIILVGDSRNIKSIFLHKYGKDTDFKGYFDKFVSYEVHVFKNEKIVTEYVDKLISQFGQKSDGTLNSAMERSGYVLLMLGHILRDALLLEGKEKVNLRQLLKLSKFKQELFVLSKFPANNSYVDKNNNIIQYINFSIKVLLSIYDGKENLNDALSKMKNTPTEKNEGKNYYAFFSQYLLEIVHEKKEGVAGVWGRYNIVRNKGNFLSPIEVDVQNGNTIKGLFYDLLVAYIVAEKHNTVPESW